LLLRCGELRLQRFQFLGFSRLFAAEIGEFGIGGIELRLGCRQV